MQSIEVTIPVSGEGVTIETKGFTGAACKDATKPLEDALGVAVADTVTREFYQQAGAKQTAKAGAR